MTMQALAPMPNRSTTSFTLSWGLLNIPVSAYTGTEEVRVARKEFTQDTAGVWHPVGRALTNKDDGSIIDRADVVRRAESTSGVWVDLADDEIAAATMPRGLAEVETFVFTRNAGQYLTEGLYQVRPRRVKGKSDPAGVKALTLLFEAMRKRKVVALIKVALRGPARYALLDADGNLRFVVTADAVRCPMDAPAAPVSKQESDLALALIESVGISTPTLVDTSALAIQAFVDQKAAGAVPEVTAEPQPTTDLLNDLLASIAANKGEKVSA
jgi:non-homologous end joining protein Ku